jgi:uncharacterized protein (TIGR02996 family)
VQVADIEVLEAHLRDHPEDTQGWRVYADWLLDQEDARGQVLALDLQLRQPSLPEADVQALRQQKAALERAHSPGWRAGLPAPAGSRLSWWCGFVVDVQLSRAPAPLQETLLALARLLEHPSGRLLTRLDLLGQRMGDRGAEILAGWPALARFRELSVAGNRLGDAGAVALAQSPWLGPLTGLYLSYNELGPDAIAALARCPRLEGLRQLTLARNPLGPAGAHALAAATFRGLSRLHVDHDGLGDEGLAALAGSRALGRLRSLQAASNGIGEAGAWALASSESLRALVELDLSDNRLGPEGAIALAGAPLGHLVRMELRYNRIGSIGAAALGGSCTLGALRELGLAANEIGASGATALLGSRTLEALTELDLSVNHVGEEDWAPAVGLPRLAKLRLERNGLSDAAAVRLALAQAPVLHGCDVRV